MRYLIPILVVALWQIPPVLCWGQTEIPTTSLELPANAAIEEPSVPAVEPQGQIVRAIEIQGNKTISVASILPKIKTRVGDPYLQAVISDDLKRLYNTGYFSDVRVDREAYEGGFKVIFLVEEKPIIEAITFSRLRMMNPRVLKNKMQLKEGNFLDQKVLNDDIRTIEELYEKKGFTFVKISPTTDIDELSHKAKVHFEINEGHRVKVRRVVIDGNTSFTDKRIQKVMKTRPAWLFNPGYLKEEEMETDIERIKAFYEKEGFIDVQASYEYEDYDRGRINVKVDITEGKRYYVENIILSGNTVFTDDKILGAMTEISQGKIFSRDRLGLDISAIRTMYFDKGYIFANVVESTSLNSETGQVQVRLDIQEGEVAYINRIKIQGNDRTRDIVVRRELRLYPGDRFDGEKLRRSKERLRNLGYFEDISYDIEDTALPDKKDLVVQVQEAKTGSFSFGGGYSTVDQLVGFVEIQQRNFDVTNWPTFTGGGQRLSLRAETGSTRNNMRLSFTEPWLFDYPVSAGFDFYHTEIDRERDIGQSYDEKRVGGNVRLGKQFSEYISGQVLYRREEVTIDNFDTDVSADLLAEEGKNTISSLGFTLIRDSRDSVFAPTKGLYLSGTVDWAGSVLGGDRDFMRFLGQGSYYIPLFLNSVLDMTVRTGVADAYGDSDKVPIFERFYAGGARTIRGYDERQVGPLDSVTDDPIGGESMLVGNIEYTIPLIDYVKMALFVDGGNVWAGIDDYASGGFVYGTGVGLRIKTPIGPMNLDYGYPLSDEPGEEERTGKFYFSVSRGF